MSLAAPPGPCGAIWIENRPLNRIPGSGGRRLCTNFTMLRAPVRSRRTTRLKRPVRPYEAVLVDFRKWRGAQSTVDHRATDRYDYAFPTLTDNAPGN
jgi:hypothetical protein